MCRWCPDLRPQPRHLPFPHVPNPTVEVGLLKPRSDDHALLLTPSSGFFSINTKTVLMTAWGPMWSGPVWPRTLSPSSTCSLPHLKCQACFCPKARAPAGPSAWHLFSCWLPYLREVLTKTSPALTDSTLKSSVFPSTCCPTPIWPYFPHKHLSPLTFLSIIIVSLLQLDYNIFYLFFNFSWILNA